MAFLLSRVPLPAGAYEETKFRLWSSDAAVQLLVSLALLRKQLRLDLFARMTAALQRPLPAVATQRQIDELKLWAQLSTTLIDAATKTTEERSSNQQREELLLDLIGAHLPRALLRCLCRLPRRSAYAADLATCVAAALGILSMPEALKAVEAARTRTRKRVHGVSEPSPSPRPTRRRRRSRSGSILSLDGSGSGRRSRSNSIALVLTTTAGGEEVLELVEVGGDGRSTNVGEVYALAHSPQFAGAAEGGAAASAAASAAAADSDDEDKGPIVQQQQAQQQQAQDRIDIQVAFDAAESPARGANAVAVTRRSPSITVAGPRGMTLDIDIDIGRGASLLAEGSDGDDSDDDDESDELDLSEEIELLEDEEALGALLDAATMASVDDELMLGDSESEDAFDKSSSDEEGEPKRTHQVRRLFFCLLYILFCLIILFFCLLILFFCLLFCLLLLLLFAHYPGTRRVRRRSGGRQRRFAVKLFGAHGSLRCDAAQPGALRAEPRRRAGRAHARRRHLG